MSSVDDSGTSPCLADVQRSICDDIQMIMATYREQEKSSGGVDTPGGLEHMGDVWRMLSEWDDSLSEATP